MNFVGKDLEAIAAALLGSVERGVGMPHERLGIHLFTEACLDSDAD